MNNNTENNANSEIVNSLSRLAVAGASYNKTSTALYQAAYDVAQEIIEATPVNVDLPRGYEVVYLSSNLGGEYFLQNNSVISGHTCNAGGVIVDATKGYYLHGDFNQFIDKAPKSVILQFAKDIREGLLDEIAEFLEKRAAAQSKIAEELEKRGE